MSLVDQPLDGTAMHILEVDGSDLMVLPPMLWGRYCRQRVISCGGVCKLCSVCVSFLITLILF